jgi:tetratricopeptide (TPR) repeat protein
METYTSIIDFNESVEAYFLRGNLYYSLGEEENALKDYTAAIEKEPQEYDLYMGIYETLMSHGKEKEAHGYLNHALEIKGDSAFDKMQKGRINFLLGENDTAITLLEEAAEGKEVQALYYLAEAYTKVGNEEAAKKNMRAYMETGVSDSYDLFQISQEELGNGNYAMALECLTTALEMDKVPNKQIIMKNLVMIYEELSDFETAKAVLKEYVKEYPDDEEAKRELTFLETRIREEETQGN